MAIIELIAIFINFVECYDDGVLLLVWLWSTAGFSLAEHHHHDEKGRQHFTKLLQWLFRSRRFNGKRKTLLKEKEVQRFDCYFERTIFGKYKRKSDLYRGIELEVIVNLQGGATDACNKGAVSKARIQTMALSQKEGVQRQSHPIKTSRQRRSDS